MQTKESWEIKIDGIAVEELSPSLLDQVKNIVKQDVQHVYDTINEAIKELVSEFLKLEYQEEELEARTEYHVNIFETGYHVSIYVVVFPIIHPTVLKRKLVLYNAERNFTSDFYTKTRNELGIKVKEQLSTWHRIAKLVKENEELRKKLEEAEATIKELEERMTGEEEEKEEEEEDP